MGLESKGSVAAAAVEGAKNLLSNCVCLKPGDSMLLVEEEFGLGYFDEHSPKIIADEARKMGAQVLTISTPRVDGPEAVPPALHAAMEHVDHTVFLNRIGDQMRFKSLPGNGSKTMVYTLEQNMLASRSAAIPHRLMVELIKRFNAEMSQRKTWRVTCPAGTDVSGEMPEYMAKQSDDSGNFTVGLFPASVHKPVPAQNMNGRIVIQRFITGTNTNVYSPEVHFLDSPIIATIRDGHAVDLEGSEATVTKFKAHSKMVADLFGLDQTFIHSWHGGLNPGVTYFGKAKDDPVRWNGMIYGSPRHLHFHTCGDYPPGEINWHIIDPTIRFDGEAFVENGEVAFFRSPDIAEMLGAFGLDKDQLQTERQIGLD